MNDDLIRLYPDWIPITEKEPTRKNFEKSNRPEFGYCIVSRTHFSPGEVIARIYGDIIRHTPELHTVQKSLATSSGTRLNYTRCKKAVVCTSMMNGLQVWCYIPVTRIPTLTRRRKRLSPLKRSIQGIS